MTVTDSIITGNKIRGGNGTFGYGGGIYNCPDSTLTLINTTLSDNSAEIGGAICNGGALTIVNSTFSGNVAHEHRGGAGAILNGGLFQSEGTLLINNSTMSGNTAEEGAGIFNVKGSAVFIQNSIVANNIGGNCRGRINSLGYNMSSDKSCSFDGPGDLNDTDSLLGPLQDNGGPTDTMALLPESPAIDAGNPKGCRNGKGPLLKTDQRGFPRPDKEDKSGCDMGAYERQSN